MSRAVRAAAMSGAGNGFVVLGPEGAAAAGDRAEFARRICRPGVSLGGDGVVFVVPEADGRIRVEFFTPDGSRAFCGNGSRCGQ